MKTNKKSNVPIWAIILIAIVYLAFTIFGVWMCDYAIKDLRRNADLSYDTLMFGEYHLDSYQKKTIGFRCPNIWYVLQFAENSQEFNLEGDLVKKQLFEETLANVSLNSTVVTVYYRQHGASQTDYEICEITINSITFCSLDDYIQHQRLDNTICIIGGIALVVGAFWLSYRTLKFFQKSNHIF